MANGDKDLVMKVAFGFVQAVLVALILGIGNLMLNQKESIARLQEQVLAVQAQVAFVQRTVNDLEIPPKWVADRLISIENKVDDHIARSGGSE